MATTTHKKTSKDTAAASKVKSDKSVSKKQYVVNGFSFTSEKRMTVGTSVNSLNILK